MKSREIFNLGAFFIMASLAPSNVISSETNLLTDYNNVVIVLDASGSMSSNMRGTTIRKMDAAKTALREVLEQVPPDTNIGLLVFSGTNISNEWVYPLGPRDNTALVEAVNLPRAGGGTPLGAYIKKGADRLLEQRAKQRGYGTYRLLIVTDGEAQDQNLVDGYIPEVLARGITVDVIGVDMKKDHTLATKAHSYRRADDPASLKRAVAEVFAEVADTGTDIAGEDAFAKIAPVSDKVAAAMLKALSTSGNQPIGEGPGGRVAGISKRKGRATSSKGDAWNIVKFILFAIVVLFFLFRRIRQQR